MIGAIGRAGGVLTSWFLVSAAFHVAPASAQDAPPVGASRPAVSVTGVWMGAMTLGATRANLTGANGEPVRFFGAENGTGPGLGVVVQLEVPVVRRLAVEAAGGWTQSTLRSRVFADLEDVPSQTLSEPLSRLTAEGAVIWTFAPAARASLFVNLGGGWMRELAGGGILRRDGTVAHAGLGVKYWWSQQPLGPPGRIGFRIEGRVHVRSRGISLGDREIGIAPAVAAGFIFRL
jgi:hypothetical protein